MDKNHKIAFLLQCADDCLILAQRNSEWCGHGPVLEQDIAITNISLDLIGQARNFYQYAATLIGPSETEDSLAYLRKERDFRNCLLVEQQNGDWAQTILRQYLFSQFEQLLFEKLLYNSDETISAIAEKALKEIQYHVRWSSEWVIRLGDGTSESHKRMEHAVNELWSYTGELFDNSGFEMDEKELKEFDVPGIRSKWEERVQKILEEATLSLPPSTFMHKGGRKGKHTEQLGYILTELQYMQRAYPGAEW